MAFLKDHIYVARNEDDSTFRLVNTKYEHDESGLNENDVLGYIDTVDHEHLHVFDPKYPKNRRLWDAPAESADWLKYTDWLDSQAWEKGQG